MLGKLLWSSLRPRTAFFLGVLLEDEDSLLSISPLAHQGYTERGGRGSTPMMMHVSAWRTVGRTSAPPGISDPFI